MGQADRWLQPEQPGDPDAETKRLDDLSWCDVLDTPPEEAFDRITRTAKFALDVPMALVSLVDRDRQWFKSRQGLAAPETPREISFCTHAIQRGDVFVVTDSWIDPRFRDNPLVTGMPFI
ncbi:MAG: GAF domain-containing protein, partial [Alphaproteobacteria bacterium]|nr:GAF domain-containing protein [Alphaproteobacteria bacterium]